MYLCYCQVVVIPLAIFFSFICKIKHIFAIKQIYRLMFLYICDAQPGIVSVYCLASVPSAVRKRS